MIKTGDSLGSRKDRLWLTVWVGGVAAVAVWDWLFLNKPALKLLARGFVNTFTIALMVTAMVLVAAWLATLGLHRLESRGKTTWYLLITFSMNLVRSIPQVVGVLFAYVWIAFLAREGTLRSGLTIFPLMAAFMTVFIFLEVVDLMRERIDHFRKLDFYNAMLVCGVPESRIINFDILWKNSRLHILNKLISVFGIAVFLQCSVDFVVSVGLSTGVSAVSLPPTLGSLLAKIDSKQDILAIGHTLTHPSYVSNLFYGHLQGISVAFLIVFTLLCVYHISNGYAERHHL